MSVRNSATSAPEAVWSWSEPCTITSGGPSPSTQTAMVVPSPERTSNRSVRCGRARGAHGAPPLLGLDDRVSAARPSGGQSGIRPMPASVREQALLHGEQRRARTRPDRRPSRRHARRGGRRSSARSRATTATCLFAWPRAISRSTSTSRSVRPAGLRRRGWLPRVSPAATRTASTSARRKRPASTSASSRSAASDAVASGRCGRRSVIAWYASAAASRRAPSESPSPETPRW